MRKILLIEDDEDIRHVTTVALEAVGGWQVTAVSSGAEGIAIAPLAAQDAILLDVSMPAMDGPTTLRELKRHQSLVSTPVILLTAKALESEQRLYAELDVAGVLFKPFNPMTLARQITTVLGWSAATSDAD